MNTDIHTMIILCVVYLLIIYILETGAYLALFGVVAIITGYFLSTIYTIPDTQLLNIFRLVFGIIGMLSLGKSMSPDMFK